MAGRGGKSFESQALAVYSRLEEDLRRSALSGGIDFKKPIMGELELCAKYGISRKSVRKALENLTAEGLLIRVQGKGTFAAPPETRLALLANKPLDILLAIPWFYRGTNEYDEELVVGITDYANRNGHKVEFSDHEVDPAEIIRRHKAGELDGVIWDRPEKDYYGKPMATHAAGVPTVAVNRVIEDVPCVTNDYRGEILDTLAFLLGIGHKKLIFVNLAGISESLSYRKEYFHEVVAELKREQDFEALYVECQSLDIRDELERTRGKGFTAMIVGGYTILGGVFSFCRTNSMEIPKDLSIICLNDSLLARTFTPAVTVFTEPRATIGRRAVEAIESMACGKTIAAEPVKIKGEMIMRKSCSIPAAMRRLK